MRAKSGEREEGSDKKGQCLLSTASSLNPLSLPRTLACARLLLPVLPRKEKPQHAPHCNHTGACGRSSRLRRLLRRGRPSRLVSAGGDLTPFSLTAVGRSVSRQFFFFSLSGAVQSLCSAPREEHAKNHGRRMLQQERASRRESTRDFESRNRKLNSVKVRTRGSAFFLNTLLNLGLGLSPSSSLSPSRPLPLLFSIIPNSTSKRSFYKRKKTATTKRDKRTSRPQRRRPTHQPGREQRRSRRRRQPGQPVVPLRDDPVAQPRPLGLDLGPGGRRRRPGGARRRRRRRRRSSRSRRRDDRGVDRRRPFSASSAFSPIPALGGLEHQRRKLQHEPYAQGAEDHDGQRQVRGRRERLREDEAAKGVDGAAFDDGVYVVAAS